MSVRVRIEHGQDAGKTWRLATPGTYVIGRHTGASIRVIDMKVSKEHCTVRLVEGNGSAYLKDLGSTHGTLLNGQPVTESPMNPGDEIRLGVTILRVLSDGAADAEATPATDAVAAAAGAGNVPAGAPANDPGLAATQGIKRKVLPPDELVGQEVAGYKVLEKIGQGGMGAVYVAEQKSLHRQVALKVLSQKLVTDAQFVDQFVNEARAAGALNHPNVVQVYDVGQENGRYFFSMEYVPGGSLEERVRKGKADWREALNWFLDAANALIFAQKRGILHRDVKPDNLMVAENGSAKLCDLGLAKKSESQDLLSQGIIGTPHFLSPEAIRRKKDIDARSDLYSLGCTFYRVLTAENPYPAKQVKDILMAHLKDPVPRVIAKNPDVPKEVDEVVFRLMQKEPEQRFASAEELYKALDKIRVTHGLEAHGIKPGGRKALVVALLAVLAAGGVAAYFLTRPPPEAPPMSAEEKARLQGIQDRANMLEATEFASWRSAQENALKEEQLTWANARATDEYEKVATETSARLDALADALEKHAKYADKAEVKKLVGEVRAEAKSIRDYAAALRTVQKTITTAHAGGGERLEKELQAFVASFRKAVDERRWLDAERIATPEELAKIVDPFKKAKVIDVLPPDVSPQTKEKLKNNPLFSEEKDVKPLVDKYVPDPTFKSWIEEIHASAKAYHRSKVGELSKLAAAETVGGYDQATEAADVYLGELPPDAPDAQPGSVRHLLHGFSARVREMKSEWEKKRDALVRADFDLDRDGPWFTLVRNLRAIGPSGMLFKVRLGEARMQADAAVKRMKTDGYRALAQEMLDDVKAVQGLFEHAQTSFAKGEWADDKIVFLQPDGTEGKPVKVKSVTADGLLAPDAVRFGDGEDPPAWLLKYLFFFGPEKKPRFTFTPEDKRALGVLAEIAVQYDLADSSYRAALAGMGGESKEAYAQVQRKLQALPREKATAEAFAEASRIALFCWRVMDEHDPRLVGDPEFLKKRGELINQCKDEIGKKLQDAQNLRAKLEKDLDWIRTLWGIAIRSSPSPLARFVEGEPEPAPGSVPPAAPNVPGPGNAPPADGGNGQPPGKPNGSDGTVPGNPADVPPPKEPPKDPQKEPPKEPPPGDSGKVPGPPPGKGR